MPRSWTDDPARLAAAGIPGDVEVAAKTALATRIVAAALDAGVPARFVAGDSTATTPSSAALVDRSVGFVLAVSCDHRVLTPHAPVRADLLADTLPARSWQKMSAGAGAKGPRLCSWAPIRIQNQQSGHHWLLLRRNGSTGETAYCRCHSPGLVPLAAMVGLGPAGGDGPRHRTALEDR